MRCGRPGHVWIALALATCTGGATAAGAPPDPTPLLTYAASQTFPSGADGLKQQADRKRLERILFQLGKEPPPDRDCAQTLGARRFAALFDDLGGLYSNIGDDAGAADAFAKALECNPRAPFLHANRASALLDAGRFEEARTEIRRELTLGHGNFDLHALMTRLDFVDHRWNEAADDARLAALEAPDAEQSTYWQCFLWLAQEHAGVSLPALADRRTASGWPAPVLEALQGTITESDLAGRVSLEPDAGRRREILAEALFYIGQSRLAAGRAELAGRYFEAVVRLGVIYFIEHHLAQAELERLRHRTGQGGKNHSFLPAVDETRLRASSVAPRE